MAFCMSEAGVYRTTLLTRLYHMEFVLDSAAEIAGLPSNTASAVVDGEEVGPCAPGSIAIIPSTGEFYMMGGTGAWYLM